MGSSFEKVIRVSTASYTKARAILPKKLGNTAESHFKDNWRKQGFEDSLVKPWKLRKGQLRSGIASVSKKSDRGRAILVKTGRLRRSFNVVVESLRRAKVINDTPYGVYHNYGNPKRNLPQRKFMGRSRNLDEKSGVLIMRMIKSALR